MLQWNLMGRNLNIESLVVVEYWRFFWSTPIRCLRFSQPPIVNTVRKYKVPGMYLPIIET